MAFPSAPFSYARVRAGSRGTQHRRHASGPSRYNVAHVRTPLCTPPPAFRIFRRGWHRPPR
ncbi:hypothetical protein CBM2615_A120055 [Cupriavidus taiwanensis]|uniref:Uncharacterized protein n=1 Tax=Cupriavidus taiwanensis TaxID=164546 RepID=A0A375DWD3_9BURK|nr:hypothetical protein CBM2614_A120054 [Cupriavidus taiwanensis]SOZ49173.1 hypothetical protein CBM2615_A120055 [Cupriavidus taiwanensis]SOZ51832.1 hypothetical protein CBM2613_A110055 [Cupriavidus taiwanensis]SPA07064.1 hypothetical protein CBM2625_A90053 [Cupriavidus taiwanensis]